MESFAAKVRRKVDHRLYLLRRDALRLIPHPCIDLGGDHRSAVLLAGSGRSGTTLVPEVINSGNVFRYITEPFNPAHLRDVAGWRLRQYIRPDDIDPAFVEPARRIFSGKATSGATSSLNRVLVARRRLVKDVVITLSLKWVRERFAGMPIVYLLRHPCAVAASRRNLEWPTDIEAQFFDQPALMRDFLAPLRDRLAGLSSTFERHVAFWCIENVVPLRQLRRGDAYVLFYESLCADPEAELGRLFAYLSLPLRLEAALAALRRPSFQARRYVRGGSSAVLAGANLIDGWRRYVDDGERARAREILSWFGLDAIYGDGSMPDAAAADAMLAAAAANEPASDGSMR